jgi:hypothetical protein
MQGVQASRQWQQHREHGLQFVDPAHDEVIALIYLLHGRADGADQCPLYCLHVKNGSALLQDPDGQEFNDLAAARTRGHRSRQGLDDRVPTLRSAVESASQNPSERAIASEAQAWLTRNIK